MHVLIPIKVGGERYRDARAGTNTTGIKSVSPSRVKYTVSQRIPGYKLAMIIMPYKVIFYILLLLVNFFAGANLRLRFP